MAVAVVMNPFTSIHLPHPEASPQPMPPMMGTYGSVPIAPSFQSINGFHPPPAQPETIPTAMTMMMPSPTYIPMPSKTHVMHGAVESQRDFIPNEAPVMMQQQTLVPPNSQIVSQFPAPIQHYLEPGTVELSQSFVPDVATPPMPHPQFHGVPPPGSAILLSSHEVLGFPPMSGRPVVSPASSGRMPTSGKPRRWSITEALSFGDGDECENIGEVIVRCEEFLDSAPIATLPPGSHIIIKMISGRRALISSRRLVGWISTRSAEGIPLIQRRERSGTIPISLFSPPATGREPNLISDIQQVILPERLKPVPLGFASTKPQCNDQPASRPRISQENLPTGVDITLSAGDVAINYQEIIVTESEDEQSNVLQKLPPSTSIGIEEVSGTRCKIRAGSLEGWVNIRSEDHSLCLMKTSGMKASIPGGADNWRSSDAPQYSGPAAPQVPLTSQFADGQRSQTAYGYEEIEKLQQPEEGQHKVAKGHFRSEIAPLPSWGPELMPPRKIGEPAPDPHLWEPFPQVSYEHRIPSDWVQYRRVLEDTQDEWEKRALNEPTIYREYTTFRATTRSLMIKRHQLDVPPDGYSIGASTELPDDEASFADEEQRERLADSGLDQIPQTGPFGKQYTQHGKLFMTLHDPRHPDPDQFRVGKKDQVETYAGVLMAPKAAGTDQDTCTFA